MSQSPKPVKQELFSVCHDQILTIRERLGKIIGRLTYYIAPDMGEATIKGERGEINPATLSPFEVEILDIEHGLYEINRTIESLADRIRD